MGEKNEVKVRLSTVVCLFIIVLLIIGLVGMYLYYNKNISNTIVGNDSEVKINKIEEKEIDKSSDFESIYKALVDSEYSNLKSFITSDNKIKEIRVCGITIYNEDYLNATRGNLSEDSNENKVMGSCIFTVEFEDIKGLTLAGSKGNIHAIEGNCLIDEKEFIFDKKTNKIELCTSLYKNEQVTEEKENTKNIIEVPTTDLVAIYCDANNEKAELFFSYIKDGKVYYFHESDYEGKTTGQYYKFSINLMGQYQYEEKMKQCEGIDNAKRIKMYNSGTGIKPVIYVITEDGKVYTGSFFEHDFALHLDNRLKEYEVEDILSKTGEMKDEFKLLLKDGTTKTVTVEL